MTCRGGTIATGLLLLALSAGAIPQQTASQSQAPVNETTPAAATSPAAQQSAPTSGANAPEMSTEELTDTIFKVKVNLVEVRAVVLDAQGHPVGNLKREDFQLFDNGKPQVISRFSVEQPGAGGTNLEAKATVEGKADQAAGLVAPERYVGYVFDDVHLQSGDLAQVRDAASRQLQGLRPSDRAAIYTTSGQNQVDFTDDKSKLHDALLKLQPRPIAGSIGTECPSVSYYMAELIQNRRDDQALQVAIRDAIACGVPPNEARHEVETAALRELPSGNHETQVSLSVVKDMVRRISTLPGKRSILIVSPGFFNPEQLQEQMEIADIALRSEVVINALDARGLYTVTPDIRSNRTASGPMIQYAHDEANANADVLRELTYATGGRFVHDNNDFDAGFRQLEAPPEYSYLLGFVPQNLKYDGRFHNLKIKVNSAQKVTVQARTGYYSPKQAPDAGEQARQEVHDEVFSREELHDLPVQMQTQFFKTSEEEARLAVVVRVDARHLHYRKADGRNQNSLTLVSAVFDRNGNYVKGNQQVLNMNWKDATLESKLGAGVTLKSNFDVKPGGYLVRLVVRDEDGHVSAQNGAVEIP